MHKRSVLLLLILFVAFAPSCKKDKGIAKTPKVYFLSKVVVHYSGVDYIDNFTYDSKNRIQRVAMQSGNRISEYTYDNADRLSTVKDYQFDGTPISTSTYKYTQPNIITVSGVSSKGVVYDDFTIDYSGKNVTKIKYIQGTNEYAYDNKGNMVLYTYTDPFSQTTTHKNYSYDNQKSPFLNIAGFNPQFNYNLYLDYIGSANNITDVTEINQHIAYEYNANGYPTKSTSVKPNTSNLVSEYTYIIK